MSGPVDGAPPPSLGGPVERRGHGLFHRHHDEDDAAAWCPQCGGEFRAGTTWCDDCGVPLSTERLAEPTADDEEVEAQVSGWAAFVAEPVEYDLSAWNDAQIAEIERQMEANYVIRQWEGQHLRVAARHEAYVDELVDALDELPDVPDDVQYVFEEWTPEQCQQLVDRLLELDIACIWDGYLLSVGEADEATVDAEVLKIDPTFPVTETAEDEDDEQPDLGIPERPWWSESPGEMVKGFLGLDP